MKVLKRNGDVVIFDRSKIVNAISKAVHETEKHTSEDGFTEIGFTRLMNYITRDIVDYCSDKNTDTISVEQIQDIVEQELIKAGYSNIAKTYILYRNKRSEIRNTNDSILKCLDEILNKEAKDSDLKRDNGNIDGDTAMGTMLQMGSNVAKTYYVNNMMSNDIKEAYLSGHIHIHDLDFYSLTVTCCQIDCVKLLKGGFNTGHGYLREPNSIGSYATLAAIAIQSDQNDCHGGQSIPNFDYSMAPGVYKSFKKALKDRYTKALDFIPDLTMFGFMDTSDESFSFYDYLNSLSNNDLDNILGYISELITEVENENSDYYLDINHITKDEFKVLKQAYEDVEHQTFQAMEGFVANLNTLHSRAGGQVK